MNELLRIHKKRIKDLEGLSSEFKGELITGATFKIPTIWSIVYGKIVDPIKEEHIKQIEKFEHYRCALLYTDQNLYGSTGLVWINSLILITNEEYEKLKQNKWRKR